MDRSPKLKAYHQKYKSKVVNDRKILCKNVNVPRDSDSTQEIKDTENGSAKLNLSADGNNLADMTTKEVKNGLREFEGSSTSTDDLEHLLDMEKSEKLVKKKKVKHEADKGKISYNFILTWYRKLKSHEKA